MLILASFACCDGQPLVKETYKNALAKAGHTLVPTGYVRTGKQADDLAAGYDGLLLCGGGDIHPSAYNEAQRLPFCRNVDTLRDVSEFLLLEAFLREGKKVLGICRGIQVIQVFFGGKLKQVQGHAPLRGEEDVTHEVRLFGIWESLGTETVNSYHFQAPDKLLPPFHCLALSQDDEVEAFCHQSLPLLGVQWHPERLCTSFGDQLFTDFF